MLWVDWAQLDGSFAPYGVAEGTLPSTGSLAGLHWATPQGVAFKVSFHLLASYPSVAWPKLL